jgi:nucleotide-binding universal stress UspA family protein
MTSKTRPALFCFDGSDNAARAIADAGDVLKVVNAVVLTVWEPLPTWEPYDPATVLTAPVTKLASRALDLEEIAREGAEETTVKGVALATAAGFTAEGRTEGGKAWRTICDVAEEIDAVTIVVGARGLSRVGSVLLGSVSSAVAVHARCPVLVVPHPE